MERNLRTGGMFQFLLGISLLGLSTSTICLSITDLAFRDDVLANWLPILFTSAFAVCLYILLRRRRLVILSGKVSQRGIFRTTCMPDGEVAGISLKRFIEEVNGCETGSVHKLCVSSKSGRRIFFYGKLDTTDTVLIDYVQRIGREIGESWISLLTDQEVRIPGGASGVPWRGSFTETLSLTKLELYLTEIEVSRLGSQQRIAYKDLTIALKGGRLLLRNEVQDKIVAKLHSSDWNFFPLLYFLEALISRVTIERG